MAKQVVTNLVDDLDGKSKAEGTVRFSINGTNFEIDLSKKNRTGFEKVLDPYIAAARTAKPAQTRTRKAKATVTAKRVDRRNDISAIRQWAIDNGHQVSHRGRIASSIIEQYEKQL